MIILGIETSHDDTSIAILENNKIVKMITFSQIKIHQKYGGTIPEIASREHVNNVALVLEEIKKDYDLNLIDYIAYTNEPGLIGALYIGFLFASAISIALNKPLIPVNHIKGHLFSVAINQKITYPAMALIVSGGHSQLMYAKSYNDIVIVGKTQDDALGEVYDKVARKLNLGFPGGPIIDKLAQDLKNKNDLLFSIPKTENELDFSFSGIKTQVINYINSLEQKNYQIDQGKIAYSFQQTILKYLKTKLNIAKQNFEIKTLILAGGVSANKEIRELILNMHTNSLIPELKYATDNGAMIAKAAQIYLETKHEK